MDPDPEKIEDKIQHQTAIQIDDLDRAAGQVLTEEAAWAEEKILIVEIVLGKKFKPKKYLR